MPQPPLARPRAAVLCLLLGLAAAAGPAGANVIGLFGDPEARSCSARFQPFETTRIHVLALVSTVESVRGAAFRVEGIGPVSSLAEIACAWNTDLAAGDILGEGVFLAFAPPLEPSGGGVVPLGTIDVLAVAEGWPAPDSFWCVTRPLAGSGAHYLPPRLVLVDEAFAARDADGWCFKANCSADCSCLAIPTESGSWGLVKSLY